MLLVAGRGHQLPWDRIRRVLVPTNGSAWARAAGEVGAHLAESCGAELALLAVVDPQLEQALTRRSTSSVEHSPATAHLCSLRFLLAPLDVRARGEWRSGIAAEELAAELDTGRYDLVVLGAVDRAGDAVALMGPTVGRRIAEPDPVRPALHARPQRGGGVDNPRRPTAVQPTGTQAVGPGGALNFK